MAPTAFGKNVTRRLPEQARRLRRVGFRSGSHILFERVPNDHWRQTPDFPELQLNIVAEPATKLAMLLAEEIHMAQLPPDLEKTAVDEGYRVISSEIPMINHYTLFGGNFHPEPNAGRKGTQPDLPYSDMLHDSTKVPWVDVRIREALNRAVNRRASSHHPGRQGRAHDGEPLSPDSSRLERRIGRRGSTRCTATTRSGPRSS